MLTTAPVFGMSVKCFLFICSLVQEYQPVNTCVDYFKGPFDTFMEDKSTRGLLVKMATWNLTRDSMALYIGCRGCAVANCPHTCLCSRGHLDHLGPWTRGIKRILA